MFAGVVGLVDLDHVVLPLDAAGCRVVVARGRAVMLVRLVVFAVLRLVPPAG